MEEQLISFETVKLAKDKGFDVDKYLSIDDENPKNINSNYNPQNYQPWYLNITQSLLQKWLREEHNIHINIEYDYSENHFEDHNPNLFDYSVDYLLCISVFRKLWLLTFFRVLKNSD